MSDHITLTGVRATGYHGVLPDERVTGQEFVVDLTVWLDLSAAAASDDLADTVSYAELAAWVVAEIQGEPADLIETVADRIAARVLTVSSIERVRVSVHKPQAPIPHPFSDVAVIIERGH